MHLTKSVKKARIRFLFALFGMLAAFDIVLLIYSNEYRNFFGEVQGVSGVMWRIILDIALTVFYGLIFWKITNGILLPRLMVWHGVLYGLLGIVMCLPWGGYFFAPFSPIGLLYLGSILWTPLGYSLSLGITIFFITSNLYLIWFGLDTSTAKPRSRGSAR